MDDTTRNSSSQRQSIGRSLCVSVCLLFIRATLRFTLWKPEHGGRKEKRNYSASCLTTVSTSRNLGCGLCLSIQSYALGICQHLSCVLLYSRWPSFESCVTVQPLAILWVVCYCTAVGHPLSCVLLYSRWPPFELCVTLQPLAILWVVCYYTAVGHPLYSQWPFFELCVTIQPLAIL